MHCPCAGYQPRDAERGVLYRIVDAHLDAFLDAAAHHAEGARLPTFVEQEFRDFLTCGVLTFALDRSARSPRAFAEVCSPPAARKVGTRPPGGSEAHAAYCC